jgi:GMP synthase-like glutamine amidotransferase
MKIGILQTGSAPDALRDQGDYPAMFQDLLAGFGFDFQSWHVEEGEFPLSVTQADAWLITGSRHGVYESHAFIPRLETFIRDAQAAGVPMVGICFGHQAMAQALGGRVEKFAGGWVVGPTEYDFDGQPITLNAWHQDQVLIPPPGAQTLARSETCEYAALGYGDWGLSIQAHPEYDDTFIQGLIDHRGRGKVPDDLLDRAQNRLGMALDRPRIAERIADFLKSAHAQTQSA